MDRSRSSILKRARPCIVCITLTLLFCVESSRVQWIVLLVYRSRGVL